MKAVSNWEKSQCPLYRRLSLNQLPHVQVKTYTKVPCCYEGEGELETEFSPADFCSTMTTAISSVMIAILLWASPEKPFQQSWGYIWFSDPSSRHRRQKKCHYPEWNYHIWKPNFLWTLQIYIKIQNWKMAKRNFRFHWATLCMN